MQASYERYHEQSTFWRNAQLELYSLPTSLGPVQSKMRAAGLSWNGPKPIEGADSRSSGRKLVGLSWMSFIIAAFPSGISIARFFLRESGFKTGEIAPLDTDGEVWRRLQFTFPNRIATEACEQILYFDSRNRHRRTDHLRSDLTVNSVAHCAHQDFQELSYQPCEGHALLTETASSRRKAFHSISRYSI